jgi:hypothetical protein
MLSRKTWLFFVEVLLALDLRQILLDRPLSSEVKCFCSLMLKITCCPSIEEDLNGRDRAGESVLI